MNACTHAHTHNTHTHMHNTHTHTCMTHTQTRTTHTCSTHTHNTHTHTCTQYTHTHMHTIHTHTCTTCIIRLQCILVNEISATSSGRTQLRYHSDSQLAILLWLQEELREDYHCMRSLHDAWEEMTREPTLISP